MRIHRVALLLGLGLSLGAAACGNDPDAPVSITPQNLEGYWLATAETGQAIPQLVHFGATAYGDEVPAGATAAEVVHFDGDWGSLVPYVVEGDVIQFQGGSTTGNSSSAWGGSHQVVRLTQDELEMIVDGETTFRRVEGCGGPGAWSGQGFAVIHDAAWGPDGSLHMIASHAPLDISQYVYLPPGRCTPYIPDEAVSGYALDVGPDGTIRIATFKPPQMSTTGTIGVIEIPPEPWTRPTLAATTRTIDDTDYWGSVAPPFKFAHLPDGGFMLIYVGYTGTGAEQRNIVEEGGALAFGEERGLFSGLAPRYFEITYEPDGAFVVQGAFGANLRSGDRGYAGQRYAANGVWSDWMSDTRPGIDETSRATIFTHAPDGTLYAAWADEHDDPELVEGALSVGRKIGDTWEVVSGGWGFPISLRVAADGTVDVFGALQYDRGPMFWSRLPPGFAKASWIESYHLDFVGGVGVAFGGGSGYFPIARSGPDGEVFLGGSSGVWRRPALEHELYPFQPLDVTFATSDVTITFPSLGKSCDAACTLMAPPSTLLPAVLEGPNAASSVVSGTYLTADSWSVIASVSDLRATLPVPVLVKPTP